MRITACVTFGSTAVPVELTMDHDIRVPKDHDPFRSVKRVYLSLPVLQTFLHF
jgi:hypothetical protein